MTFLQFLVSGFLLKADINDAHAASESFVRAALPTDSNPDRVAVIGVSPGTDFGLSSETDPTGVEEEFRRSQDVIVKSILEVERIMGFPATEGNFYVYFPQGLSAGVCIAVAALAALKVFS